MVSYHTATIPTVELPRWYHRAQVLRNVPTEKKINNYANRDALERFFSCKHLCKNKKWKVENIILTVRHGNKKWAVELEGA